MQDLSHLVCDATRRARMLFYPALLFASLFSVFGSPANAAHDGRLVIAAANSTCKAVQAVGAAFLSQQPIEIEYICKSSGLLAKGLVGGAISADYYISANAKWMDVMVEAKLVQPEAVQSLWGNELVVAAPLNTALTVGEISDLRSENVRQVFIGDPSTAPFGRYTKQAFNNAQIWDGVKQKITTQKHITLLAENLSRADANTLGVLFSTNVTPQLRTLFKIDSNLHNPIHYFSAPLVSVEGHAIRHDFDAFLNSEDAQNIFRDYGFKIIR